MYPQQIIQGPGIRASFWRFFRTYVQELENFQPRCRCVTILSCEAALTEETIEECNADIPQLMDVAGEDFELFESDSDDEELEFVDSIV